MRNGLANGLLAQYSRHSEEESAMKVYRGVVMSFMNGEQRESKRAF